MMYSLLFVLGLICVASAGMPICCTPKNFTVFEGMVRGEAKTGQQPTEMQGSLMVFVDGDNMKMAIDEAIMVSGQVIKIKIIQDYSEAVKMQYVIVNGKCTKTPTGVWNPTCIPGNAQSLGSGFFGGFGGLRAESYQYQQGDLNLVVSVATGCVPIVAALYSGNEQGGSETTLAYLNFTAGVRDPSVFDVPSICNQAEPLPSFVHAHLRRRRSPLYTIV